MIKIGVVSQKGGVGKSTVARDVARQFASEGWRVMIADLDLKQTTSCDWNAIRQQAGFTPDIAVMSFQSPTKALVISGYDLLVFDGKPHSDIETKRIAEASDLVIIPTGPTRDDLTPQVRLAFELEEAGVPKKRILFIINNVQHATGGEVDDARSYIKQAGFDSVHQVIPRRVAYANAQNSGRSLSEVSHAGLAEYAKSAVVEIGDRLKEIG